jgi:hypothetical protein
MLNSLLANEPWTLTICSRNRLVRLPFELCSLPDVLCHALDEVPAVVAVLDSWQLPLLSLLIYFLHKALDGAGPVSGEDSHVQLLLVEPTDEGLRFGLAKSQIFKFLQDPG